MNFRVAAEKYLAENMKKTIKLDVPYIEALYPIISHVNLEDIHSAMLKPYMMARDEAGMKIRTMNYTIVLVNAIKHMAYRYWRHDDGKPVIPYVNPLPTICKKTSGLYGVKWRDDARQGRVLTIEEQREFVSLLDGPAKDMFTFSLYTGLRESEVTGLMWDEEKYETDVFMLDKDRTKSGKTRPVILCGITREIIDRYREMDDVFVFTQDRFKRTFSKISVGRWKRAKEMSNIGDLRVHDARTTFASRLRDIGAHEEDIADLLGHVRSGVTARYAKPSMRKLKELVCKLETEYPLEQHGNKS